MLFWTMHKKPGEHIRLVDTQKKAQRVAPIEAGQFLGHDLWPVRPYSGKILFFVRLLYSNGHAGRSFVCAAYRPMLRNLNPFFSLHAASSTACLCWDKNAVVVLGSQVVHGSYLGGYFLPCYKKCMLFSRSFTIRPCRWQSSTCGSSKRYVLSMLDQQCNNTSNHYSPVAFVLCSGDDPAPCVQRIAGYNALCARRLFRLTYTCLEEGRRLYEKGQCAMSRLKNSPLPVCTGTGAKHKHVSFSYAWIHLLTQRTDRFINSNFISPQLHLVNSTIRSLTLWLISKLSFHSIQS